jgi:transposase
VAPETASLAEGARFRLDTSHHRPGPRLLPDATVLRLEACEVDDITAQITLRVQSTQTRAPCPLCATPARRIHSDYGRTLTDLP